MRRSLLFSGSLLLVEDDPDDQFIFQELIDELDDFVPSLKVVEHCQQAEKILETEAIVACFVDFRLGAESGLDFIQKNSLKYPNIPFMLLTGQGGDSVDAAALEAGAKDYLKKDELSSEHLLRCLRYVTTQINHEALIRSQRDRVNELLKSMGETFWVYNVNHDQFDEIGPGIENLTGFPAEDFIKNPQLWMERVLEEDRSHRLELLTGNKDHRLVDFKYTLEDREGRKHIIRERVKDITSPLGEKLWLGISRDVTKEESSLRELNLLREVFQQVDDAVLITDAHLDQPDGPSIVFANPAFLEMCGYSKEEVIGNTPKMLQGPKTDRAMLDDLKFELDKGNEFRAETINYKKDGSEYIVTWSITPVKDESGTIKYFASFQRDITLEKLKRKEEQRNQRLESLGNLVGGISHDLNNILSPILMGAGMLEFAEDQESKKAISDSIISSTERASGVVSKLLAFARGGNSEKQYLCLKSVIQEVYKIATETFPRKLDVHLKLPKELWVTHCNENEIQQVLLNLAINAKDSMSDKEDGTLLISAENQTLKTKEADLYGLEEGPYVCLKVTDTGTGIPPEILEMIYDPFFTTKVEESGTGLGLSSSLGIIKSHQGAIHADTEKEKGTTFSVILPATPDQLPDPADDRNDFHRGEGQSILVIDDEPMICELVCNILDQYGYKSQGVSSSIESLKLFSQNPDSFDAIISDMMMPQVDGLEITKRLLTERPELPILIMTGYIHHEKLDQLKEAGVKNIIAKPIKLELLMKSVNNLFSD